MSKEISVQLKLEKKTSKSIKTSRQLDNEEKVCTIHHCTNDKDKNVRPLNEQSILKINDSASVRQSSSYKRAKLLDITDKLSVELDASIRGYYCWCFQSFTNIAQLKKNL